MSILLVPPQLTPLSRVRCLRPFWPGSDTAPMTRSRTRCSP